MKRLLNHLNEKIIFTVVGLAVPLFVLIPIIRVTLNIFEPNSSYYKVLVENGGVIDGVITTIELIIKVGLLSVIIGFLLAYIITFYQLKFHRLLNILFVIPLTIPVYVAAYTYSNIFHNITFLETILRSEFMMNGAVFIYSAFLYPYVYLAAKSYLNKNMTTYLEASSTLGIGKLKTFFKVILPLSRPVIIGSVIFVLFETLSDFAVVEFYGVLTLSRYINLSWFASGDFISASKFSVYILFIMYFLIFVERVSRRRTRYINAEITHKKLKKEKPNTKEGIIIYSFISVIILLTTLLPIGQMIISVVNNIDYIERLDVLEIVINSLTITLLSIGIIIFFALLVATITVYLKGPKKHLLASTSTIGYAVPSMVLALGIYIVFIQLDQWLYFTFKDAGLDRMIFTSSIAILVIAFFIKFFSIAYSNLNSAYNKIDHNILEASETLGENKLTTLYRVSTPMLKKSIIAVSIILFIDMIKELTLVYSLRPFNFKTLSTEIYRYAGNEQINIAAFPSLIIIFISILLVIYIEGGFKHVKTK